MELPPDILDEPFGVAAFHIYAQSWQTPDRAAETVQNAGRKLCQVIMDSGDKEEAVYCSIRALHKFACKAPPALDHALDVMAQSFAQLPESTELPAIKGPEGALLILKWWLVDWSQRFKGSAYGDDGSEESRRAPSDAQNTKDGTNVFFEQSEVSNSIDSVLERTRNLQEARKEFIIALAMQARCHSKGISHWSLMDSAVPLIDNALTPHHPNQIPIWGKTEVIGCSVLLRGCAKTLISRLPAEARESKLAEWIERFGKFLYQDPCGTLGGDFVLKVHAAVRVQSLGI